MCEGEKFRGDVFKHIPVLENLGILLQVLEISSYTCTSDYMHICQCSFLFLCGIVGAFVYNLFAILNCF